LTIDNSPYFFVGGNAGVEFDDGFVSFGCDVDKSCNSLSLRFACIGVAISCGNGGTCAVLWSTWGWEAQPTSPSKLMHSRLLFLDIILGLSEFRFLVNQFTAKLCFFGSGFVILFGNGNLHVIVAL